jgi:hypothetical protein
MRILNSNRENSVMRRWFIVLAVAGIAGLYGCSEQPLETSCCRLLTSIEISPPTATVASGGTVQFDATVRDDSDVVVETEIAWSVSSSAVGSITGTGSFEALSAGNTYVRSVVGVLRDSALVTVTP